MKESVESAKKLFEDANMARLGLIKTLKTKTESNWSSLVESGKKEEDTFECDVDMLKKAAGEVIYVAKGIFRVSHEKITGQWGDLVKKGSAL